MARDHFIPLFHQKLMMGEGSNWFFYEKVRPEKAAQKRNPKTTFAKKHFYSKFANGSVADTSSERRLSEIENEAAPIMKRLVADALKNRFATLSKLESDQLFVYMTCLHRRTTDVYIERLSPGKIRSSIEGYFDAFELLYGPINDSLKQHFLEKSKLDEMTQNIWSNLVVAVEGPALALMKTMGLALAVAPINKSFVIGSSPIIRFDDYPKQPLGEPGVEMWLPIGQRVAVSPMGQFGECKIVKLNTQQTRKINESIFKKSSVVAASSKALLSSLVESKTSELTIINKWPQDH